jgi:pimeloyl-ACP methyl ester carboxylesterase
VIETFALDVPGGIRLECRAAGAPAGARVMLLHGFPEAAFVWDEVMQRLAPRARCVAPHLRGYAGSSAPTEVAAYRPRLPMGDIVAAIEALGAPLDVLVAHDWGGALAWNLAAQRPDLLKRLVVVNAPHPAAFLRELRHSAEQQAASAYMNFFCRPDAEALLAANDYARLWPFFGDAAWLTPALRARYREVWSRGLTGALNYYRASPLRPATGPADLLHTLVLDDAAVTVRVPTTVIWGEQDRALRPGLLDGLERWVPDLRLVRVADASHWVVHERPALVAAEIERALT